ncbi:MAG: hypothetical protein PHV30_11265 [Candidatus Margulisbacteria bacterium]|nr:hypothetical protein [Candidatus Margulisiibacteriota bacterium]
MIVKNNNSGITGWINTKDSTNEINVQKNIFTPFQLMMIQNIEDVKQKEMGATLLRDRQNPDSVKKADHLLVASLHIEKVAVPEG